jgi:hypothetical protein
MEDASPGARSAAAVRSEPVERRTAARAEPSAQSGGGGAPPHLSKSEGGTGWGGAEAHGSKP